MNQNTIAKPNLNDIPEYYHVYVNQVPNKNPLEVLESGLLELLSLKEKMSLKGGDYRYSEGKWSIKELLLHMIDTEQIMTYRALRIARQDKLPMPGFDQDDYIDKNDFSHLSLEDVLNQYQQLRSFTLSFFNNLSLNDFEQSGTASDKNFTALGLLYIIVGHEQHHLSVLKERYLDV